MSSVAVVPAAGQGRRFGSQKLLAAIDGQPMLERTIRSLLDAAVSAVTVVLDASAGARAAISAAVVPALSDPRVTVVHNPDSSRGMFSSIQIGMTAATGDPVLILPGDMPFVRPETIASILATFTRLPDVISPRCGGKRGHPIAIPARLIPSILGAPAGANLKTFIDQMSHVRVEIEVTDAGIFRDVDSPEDLV
jgi:molybdenum cofactor cytidylyltransferase